MVVAAVLPGTVFAQDDDGWGEITGLMNGLSGANQQLLSLGVPPLSAGPSLTGLTPGFAQGLSSWAQTYASVLESVDGAFDVDGAGTGQQGTYDPFSANAPNPLWEQLGRWQAGLATQGVTTPGGRQVYPNPLGAVPYGTYRGYR